MGKIYYLFSIVLIFFSLQPVFSQAGCNDLEITAVEDGSVCGGGSVVLKATSSGAGDEIYWYDAVTGGTYLGSGDSFATPLISTTTSYWASEIIGTGVTLTGEGKIAPTAASPGGYTLAAGLEFTATSPFTIVDVEAFSYAAGGVISSIQLQDSSGQMIQEILNYPVPQGGAGASMVAFTIPLNFNVPAAGSYRLMVAGATASLARDSGAANSDFPHDIGSVGEITGGILTASSSASYYYFYNWTVSTGSVTCESPRKEVIATVDNVADEEVTSLPYTHSENTETYDNNYTGVPGSDCGATDDYLNGYDVVYKYTADDDYVLTVSLDSISEQYSAVFVYESCADIGDSCAAEGSVAEDSTDSHGFDMLVEDGETYYFVVSSADPTESFDYTLNINGYGCNDIPAPIASETSPYFMTGDFLSSLEMHVDVLEFSQGVKWYSDSGLTTEITDPDNEVLVDGKSYYITQEVIECEGGALELTPREFDCSVLAPNVLTPTVELCVPGGYAKLKAELSAAGSELFWYESKTDTIPIQTGGELDLGYVDESVSYWVTEVSLSTSTPTNALASYCMPNMGSSGCNLSDHINDFILEESTGNKLIEHLGSGCSAGAYDDQTENPNYTATLIAGETYDFSATFGTSSQYLRIWIDYDGNGSFEDTDEFVFHATTAGSTTVATTGSFTVPEDAPAMNTVMRVRTTFSTGAADSCTQTSSYGEVHDYKVIIIGQAVDCESDKVEVEVIISDDIPEAPEVENNYVFCGIDTYTLADIEVEGDQLVWYDRIGNELEESTEVEDGKTYYVVDKSGGCVSEIAEVYVSIREISELPIGNTEQEFTENQTLADLDVRGVQLKWYADADKEDSLEKDTVLEDDTTYYVTQTKSGLCESEVLAIKVIEVLGVDDFHFDNFDYFPNPVEHTLTLSNEKEIQSVEVYDMLGKIILKQGNIDKNKVNLDFENIATGNYLMKVFVEDSMKTIHIIKK